jgi:hypothetical protein
MLDIARRTRADGTVIRGLTAGCFFDHFEPYAGPAQEMWWRGVIMKHGVHNGDYTLEEIPLTFLRELYE